LFAFLAAMTRSTRKGEKIPVGPLNLKVIFEGRGGRGKWGSTKSATNAELEQEFGLGGENLCSSRLMAPLSIGGPAGFSSEKPGGAIGIGVTA